MITSKVSYYEGRLYLGCRENYNGLVFDKTKLLHQIENFQVAQSDLIPVRVTDTLYKTSDYMEHGYEVAIINYPRNPRTREELSGFIHNLAQHLLVVLRQNRISVVEPDGDITMYEHPSSIEKHK